MKLIISLLFFCFTLSGFSQNPVGFDKMCGNYIKGTVPLATPEQLKFEMSKISTIYILDAREEKEYETSHIKTARFIGFDNFKITSVADIPKSSKVYVYCSIGYRSEKIGEKLLAAGFKSVYNLYGGIFNWANNGYPLIDDQGKATKAVHGYNKKWGKWLNDEKCEKRLN